MQNRVLRINEKDNIIVALADLKAGETIELNGRSITLKENIKAKHKFTEFDFKKNDKVFQYGVCVGKMLEDAAEGSAITTANLTHSTDGFSCWEPGYKWTEPEVKAFQGRTFKGFVRPDGQVGTSNNWLVIPLVFCENNNLMSIRDAFLEELGYARTDSYKDQVKKMISDFKAGKAVEDIVAQDFAIEERNDEKVFPNVDGLKFLFHSLGCGGSDNDSETLCKLLAGYVNHPNVAGATILSLGCQKAQIGLIKGYLNEFDVDKNKPVYFLEQQQIGKETDIVKQAIGKTFEGLVYANSFEREETSITNLKIGVECGGSDGFSGISANPCIGQVSDMIVSLGGTAVLSEFPELCGVEQEMINRCKDEETANKFIDIMRRYQARAEADGSSMDANPSPGNVKDGLITDAIKSAGAAKKGGSSIVQDVQDYPGYITQKGLNLLNTPGNDVESTTGLAGAGCNLILFSTGLGTPTGNPVTPVIKVSSNTVLAERMPDIIDFNTGRIIDGEQTLVEAGNDLLELCIKVASGEVKTKAVQLGQDDFIPWKRDVSL